MQRHSKPVPELPAEHRSGRMHSGTKIQKERLRAGRISPPETGSVGDAVSTKPWDRPTIIDARWLR